MLLKDPLKFQKDFTLWAFDRGISWRDPILLQKILASGLKPESLTPPEFLGMLADPSLGLCDPKLVAKVFDVSKQNLTQQDLQVSKKLKSKQLRVFKFVEVYVPHRYIWFENLEGGSMRFLKFSWGRYKVIVYILEG